MGKTKREAGRERRRQRTIAVFQAPDVWTETIPWIKDQVWVQSAGTWKISTRHAALLLAAGAVKMESHPIRDAVVRAEFRKDLRFDTSVLKDYFGEGPA